MHHRNLVGKLLVLAALATPAGATAVFDTFAPMNGYDFPDVDVNGPGKVAFSFTVPAGPDYTLVDLVVPLSTTTPGSASTFFLHERDPGTGLPATLLTAFNPSIVQLPQPGSIFTTTPVTPGIVLQAGVTYWLVHQPQAGREIGWQQNVLGVTLPGAYTLTGNPPWTTAFDRDVCFRLNGSAAAPQPSCSVSVPPGVQSGTIAVTVDTASMSSISVDIAVMYSVDGGLTYQFATMTPGAPNPNPVTGAAVGQSLFLWDSIQDMVGTAAPAPSVVVRVTVDDSVSSTQCMTTLAVDNVPTCGGVCGDCNLNQVGPDVLDALTAAQISAGLTAPTAAQVLCCDVNVSTVVEILDALLIAQSAAGLAVALMCL